MAKGSGYRADHNTVFDAINPGISHKIISNSTSKQTGSISQGTNWVKIYSSEGVWIRIGTNPTAQATNDDSSGSSFFHQGETTDFYIVRRTVETDIIKLAVIQDKAPGEVIIVEGK